MDVEAEASTSAPAEAAPKPKISTSGPRMSRREEYRASKGLTVKQTPRTHFPAMGESASLAPFSVEVKMLTRLPCPAMQRSARAASRCVAARLAVTPVSYTHLTLPTIYSV